MYFNVRISSKIFYFFILACILFTIYIFVFSSKGFLTLDSQKVLIDNKKEKIEELNRRKTQISNNIERLKNDEMYMDIPIIVMSSMPEKSAKSKLNKTFVDYYISKDNFNQEELASQVKQILTKYHNK